MGKKCLKTCMGNRKFTTILLNMREENENKVKKSSKLCKAAAKAILWVILYSTICNKPRLQLGLARFADFENPSTFTPFHSYKF
jgi:hypothetical protein